jgi:pyruvate formate lyase activating enzyme
VNSVISRREFLAAVTRYAVVWGSGLCLPGLAAGVARGRDTTVSIPGTDTPEDVVRSAPRARFWTTPLTERDCRTCHGATDTTEKRPHTHEKNIVQCLLCARNCAIRPGERGRCKARMNVDGTLRSLVYGRPMTIHIDPIEKKPFYHYLPGSTAYSLATSGCPLRCKFCQNWQISQAGPEDYRVSPRAPSSIVRSALDQRAPVIAFTYNEPTVFAEYMLDIAREARAHRLHSVLVSCGFMNNVPLAEMCAVLDAIKIDLKGFSETFYRSVCDAELKPVLRSIVQIARSPVHLEIVNLVVPTLNDSAAMIASFVDWIAGELGPDVPIHFTRFHPDYQLLNLPPTPVATLVRAREAALRRGIRYAYVGNVPNHEGNHTYCPSCRRAVIRRSGFFITEVHMNAGRCAFCRREIAGVWA